MHRQQVGIVAVVVVLVVAIWDQSYNGRRDLVASQRAGCTRGMLDRHVNAEGWYSAYLARIALANATPEAGLAREDRKIAHVYLTSAASLNSRTDVAHSVTWPPGSKRLPLGPGGLDCHTAFPDPRVFEFGGF